MSFLGTVATKGSDDTSKTTDTATATLSVPVGSSLVAALVLRITTTATFNGFTDSAGNSYSVIEADMTNGVVVGYCAETTAAIVAGTTTFTWATIGSDTDACFAVLAFDGPLTGPGSATVATGSGSSHYSQAVTPAAAGDTIVWVFGSLNVQTSAAKTGDGAQAAVVLSGTHRAMMVGYSADVADTSTLTQTVTWQPNVASSVSVAIDFAPRAAGSAPTDLSNLLFWYKADAITGLTNGQALNTNATLWPDSGPNGWHITSFAATCPTWTASATNGLPAVYFGSTGTGLLTLPSAALSAFTSKPGVTVYAVLGGVNGANIEWLNAKTGTSTKGRLVCLRDSSGNLGFNGRRLDTDSIVTISDSGNAFSAGWNITTVITDWTNNKVGTRLNGDTETSHTSVWGSGGNSDSTASYAIAIGGDSNGNTNKWAGYISEIFCFDRVLTSTEQAQMDSYLSDRYNITVADYISVTVPDPPTGATATPGDGSASVAFTAPVSDGGASITGYTVTSSPGGFTGTGPSSPITVSGLTNGVAYTFTVHATNSVGDSSESSASSAVTPVAPVVPPTADAGVDQTVTAGDTVTLDGSGSSDPSSETLTYAWTQVSGPTVSLSDDTAMSPTFSFPTTGVITSYTVTVSPSGKTQDGTESPIVVTGLAGGTAVTATVHATNSFGDSGESTASASVTPTGSVSFSGVAEVDAVGSFVRSKALTFSGATVEADAASGFSRSKSLTFTGAEEADVAGAFTSVGSFVFQTTIETDISYAFDRSKAGSFTGAIEEGSAGQFTSQRSLQLGTATESSSANMLVRSKLSSFGTATESDSAGSLARSIVRKFDGAVEVASAGTFGRSKEFTIEGAVADGVAGTFVRSKLSVLQTEQETDSAGSFLRTKTLVFSVSTEDDAAWEFKHAGSLILGTAVESGTAEVLNRAKAYGFLPAGEVSSAGFFVRAKSLSFEGVQEADSAYGLNRIKAFGFGTTTESGTVGTLVRSKQLVVVGAVEADKAGTIPFTILQATVFEIREGPTYVPFEVRYKRHSDGRWVL